MATTRPQPHNVTLPAWTRKDGLTKCSIRYRVRFVRERWRRVLALVFAGLIALMVGVFAAAVQPVSSALGVFMLGAVCIVGMTLIALVFGIEIQDVSITKDGAVLNFGDESEGDDLAVAVEWLAATGAPNWLVVLALLTRPTTWAKEAKARVSGVLDMVVPGGNGDGK